MSLFLISLVSASSIGVFQQGKTIPITNYCSTADCTYANLSSITYPNGTVSNLNSAMIQSNNEFSYSFSNTTQLGTYYFVTCSNPNGIQVCEKDSFEITVNGQDFSTGKAISYIGFIVILLFTFLLCSWGAVKVKWKHKTNSENKIISINDFRYVKVFLFAMDYILVMFLFGLSYKFFNEANIQGFTNFFNFIYQLLLRLMYPLIVAIVIIFFIIFINNLKLKKKLDLGL